MAGPSHFIYVVLCVCAVVLWLFCLRASHWIRCADVSCRRRVSALGNALCESEGVGSGGVCVGRRGGFCVGTNPAGAWRLEGPRGHLMVFRPSGGHTSRCGPNWEPAQASKG